MVVMVSLFGGVSLMAGWLVFAWAVARAVGGGAAQAVAYALQRQSPPAREGVAGVERAGVEAALEQVMRRCAVPWVNDSGSMQPCMRF